MSKEGSAALWRIANKYFYKLYTAKKLQRINKKVAQFRQIRRQMYRDNVPQIHMEYAYRQKQTGEITTAKNLDSTPRKRFPPSIYEPLYEIATIEVI